MPTSAEPAQPWPDGRRHVAALDGIRGLAILLVMGFHMTNLGMWTPFDRYWFGLAGLGASGVNLFFVLSGFLITGILLDAKDQPNYFKNFYARRVLRIFPLYYAVVFVSLVVLPHVPGMKDLSGSGGSTIGYWLFVSNFSVAFHNQWRHRILDVTWSLAIEEQFYFVWPTVVLLCRRRTLLILCAAMMLTALITRAILITRGYGLIPIVTLTPCRLDGLAAGAAVAVMFRGPTFKRLFLPAAMLGPLALAYLIWTHRVIDLWEHDPIAEIFGFSAEAIVFAALLILALDRPLGTWASFLSQRWIGLFGRLSFALYLFHLPIRAVVRDKVYGPDHYATIAGSPILGQAIFYVLATTPALLAASLSWHGYEKHFLKLKRLFPMTKSPRFITDQTAHQTQSHSA